MTSAALASPRLPQYLETDEEEEDRRLSALHGEAADDDDAPNARKRKDGPAKRQQNTTLTDADAKAAAEFEEKVRRKRARPVLLPAALKGEKGLIFVRRAFPAAVPRFRAAPRGMGSGKGKGKGLPPKSEAARRAAAAGKVDASARYVRGLMAAYRDFAAALHPSLVADDVFLKIDELGAKKEVKDYMNVMREDVMREHVKGALGEEKAQRILDELQYGMRAGRHQNVECLKEKARARQGQGRWGDGAGAAVGERRDKVQEGGSEPRAPRPKRVAGANPYAKKGDDAVAEAATAPMDAGPAAGGEETDAAPDDKPMADAGCGSSEEGEEEEVATFSVDGDAIGADEACAPAAEDDDDTAKEPVATAVAVVETEESAEGTEEGTAEVAIAEEWRVTVEHSCDATKGADEEGAKDADIQEDDAIVEEPQGSPEGIEEGAAEDAVNSVDNIALEMHENASDENEEASPEPCAGGTAGAGGEGNPQSPARECPGNEPATQETLTLAASQLDAMEPDFSQEGVTPASATQGAQRGEEGHFSQMQDCGRFSQMPESAWTESTRFTSSQGEERFSQTQDDGRFSQTQDGDAGHRPIVFEEEEEQEEDETPVATSHPEEDREGANENYSCNDPQFLGQTMETQLSMEY